MQAIFFLSLISMIMAIMASMIAGGSSGASQLTADRVVETREFFKGMSKVVLSDITHEYLNANPQGYTDIGDYIRNYQQLRQLAPGRYENPATDAWGRPLEGRIFTVYESLQSSGNIRVVVPVTAIAFVSAGPDGEFQTVLPTVTMLSQVIGMQPPAGSDDIVLTFHNRRAQEEQFAAMQASLRRIATASVKELQTRVSDYRQQKLKEYQDQVTGGVVADIDNIDITNDPAAPRFLPLTNTAQGLANRRALGIDGEFATLERKINGGSMEVTSSAPALLSEPLTLRLVNGSTPTSWGNPRNSFNYQIEVTAIE